MASARFQLCRVAPGEVSWRFMASNNRELARSPWPEATESAARDLVMDLRERLTDARSAVFLDREGRWRWQLLLDDSPAAVGSRAYLRRVECESPRAQFLVAAGSAPVSTTLALFRVTGSPTVVLLTPRRPLVERPVRGVAHEVAIRRTPLGAQPAH